MKFKPTLEIAENSIKQCLKEFNQQLKGEYTVQRLEDLKERYEKEYKSFNENYLEDFRLYTIFEIVLIVMEALSLDRVENLALSEEELKIAAQELYEHWV